jgi:diguanylate cyclase (GGDEF)-like protein
VQRYAYLTEVDLSRPAQDVLQQGLNQAVELTGSAAGVVYLAEASQLCPAVGNGVKLEALERLAFGEGLPGRVAKERRGLHLNGVPEQDALRLHFGFAEALPREIAAHPLLLQDQLLGVMLLATTGHYSDEESLRRLAEHLALHYGYARSQEQMERLSITDSQTGLYNRRYVTERLEVEFSRAFRYGSELSLLIMDLDHFRQINDRFGPSAGDAALAEVARMIRSATRDSDLCARYDGEEFMVVLPHTNREQAAIVAEKIREAVARAEIPALDREPLTISIGGACYPDSNALSLSELVQKTDEALTHAKSSGRNRSFIV